MSFRRITPINNRPIQTINIRPGSERPSAIDGLREELRGGYTKLAGGNKVERGLVPFKGG